MKNLKQAVWENPSARIYSRECNSIYVAGVGQVREQVYEGMRKRILNQIRQHVYAQVVLNEKS